MLSSGYLQVVSPLHKDHRGLLVQHHHLMEIGMSPRLLFTLSNHKAPCIHLKNTRRSVNDISDKQAITGSPYAGESTCTEPKAGPGRSRHWLLQRFLAFPAAYQVRFMHTHIVLSWSSASKALIASDKDGTFDFKNVLYWNFRNLNTHTHSWHKEILSYVLLEQKKKKSINHTQRIFNHMCKRNIHLLTLK